MKVNGYRGEREYSRIIAQTPTATIRAYVGNTTELDGLIRHGRAHSYRLLDQAAKQRLLARSAGEFDAGDAMMSLGKRVTAGMVAGGKMAGRGAQSALLALAESLTEPPRIHNDQKFRMSAVALEPRNSPMYDEPVYDEPASGLAPGEYEVRQPVRPREFVSDAGVPLVRCIITGGFVTGIVWMSGGIVEFALELGSNWLPWMGELKETLRWFHYAYLSGFAGVSMAAVRWFDIELTLDEGIFVIERALQADLNGDGAVGAPVAPQGYTGGVNNDAYTVNANGHEVIPFCSFSYNRPAWTRLANAVLSTPPNDEGFYSLTREMTNKAGLTNNDTYKSWTEKGEGDQLLISNGRGWVLAPKFKVFLLQFWSPPTHSPSPSGN